MQDQIPRINTFIIGENMIILIIRIISVLLLVTVISLIIDNRRFVVRRYLLHSSKIKSPVRLVFLADLHEKLYGDDNNALVEAVKAAAPDAILVGGDLIVSGRVYRSSQKSRQPGEDGAVSQEWMENSLSLMKRLTQICPVWFVQGNHELRLEYYEELHEYNEKFIEEMEKAGVRMLHNGVVDPLKESSGGMDSGVLIHGLELPIRFYKKFRRTKLSVEEIREIAGNPDRSSYVVLLTHMPAYFPQYAQWGSDLCLCGHVHGGLMRLPVLGGVVGTRPSLFPKYSGGQYFYSAVTDKKKHLSSMVLTCGLGMHTLPIRIFNPGEVSVIELEPVNKKQEDNNGTK